MKKTGRIICLILTFFVCAFFSACKIDYSGLKMGFYSNSGQAIDSVRLLIDPAKANEHLDQQTIAVAFDGIKEKYIGEVLVYTMPEELAVVSNQNLEGNKCFFDLSAVEAGSGKIIVKHMSTGKQTSLDLVVDKKTTTVATKVQEYVVAIPSENQAYYFDQDQLITQNGSDQIGFKLASSTMPNGVLPLTTEFEGIDDSNILQGLVLGANIRHNESITIYPVGYMQGYDDIDEYQTQTIKITFVRAITDDLFILDTDEVHKDNGLLNFNQPFHLIAKDTTQAVGQNYQYNNIGFDLKYLNSNNDAVSFIKNENGSTNTIGLEYLQKYYDIEWDVPTQFKNLLEVFINETAQTMQVVVEAKDYSSEIAKIKIRLTPKVKGNLLVAEKTVQIKCDVKPSSFEISVQGKVQKNNGTKNVYNIDLYDYYRATDSAYGANFTFKPLVEYAYADLKNIKIIVDPAVLDVVRNLDATSLTGTNPVSGLENLQSAYAANRYLLQFHIDGRPMQFTIDQNTGMAVSDPVLYQEDLKRVQIKYTEISTNANDWQLNCEIENYYSGDKEYLKDIQPTKATLQFNHKEGIQSVDVFAGVLTKGAETDNVATLDDTKSITQVYINRASKDNNVFFLANIKGDKNKAISTSNFNIKVIGGQNHPLKLLQNFKGNLDLANAKTEINFDYDLIGGNPNNAVIFGFEWQNDLPITDVGYYQIIISYADETVFEFSCFVYEELNDEEISVDVKQNPVLIENDIESGKLYAAYNADYIVKADKSNAIVAEVQLPLQFTTDYILGYDFEINIVNDGLNEEVSRLDADVQEYATLTVANNKALLSFTQGSVFNSKLAYIELSIKVKKQGFLNIITKDGIVESGITQIRFFVYEEIKKDQIKLNHTYVNGYWNSLLGAYDKSNSGTDLEVSMTNSTLWNYVQPQVQNVEDYKIGSQLVKVLDSASFSETETYYLSNGTTVTIADEEEFNTKKSTLYVKSANVVWYTSNSDALKTNQQTQNGISLEFVGKSGQIEYDVYAMVKQFNLPEVVLRCHIVISEPIVTDKITITSQTKQISGTNSKRVISLKAGESYTMQVENYSNQFETLPSNQRIITNPGFEMLVIDKSGNVHDSVVSVVDDTLRVKENFVLTADLRVLVFARDALKDKLQDASGYNDPESFLMWDSSNPDNPSFDHRSAYAVIDLIVSNGSKQNPYPIFNEQDFWAIDNDTTGLAKTKYYQLMNNIYLNGVKTINNFTGGISTYTNDTYYTIYGLTLSNTIQNLFTNFSGTMQNINFDVRYTYNIASTESLTNFNFGVFANLTEQATLTNVTVNATGANLVLYGTDDNYLNFGTLVGFNNGVIEYTNQTLTGATVNLSVAGNKAYVGGLVGLNQGTIKTNFNTATAGEQSIKFVSFLASQGNVANVNITATGFNSGAVGGAVGFNDAGKLAYVYTNGKIFAKQGENLNNVGGVIGKNKQAQQPVNVVLADTNPLTFDFATANLNNLKSSVQINATTNIGGITAVDENGIYSNSKYQILANSTYGIVGKTNVGGLIGHATNSMLEYCSVFSYRWDYARLNQIGTQAKAQADISAETDVAGMVGFAVSTATTLNQGELNLVAIKNSSVNAFVYATDENSANINMFVGLQNGDATKTISGILDCYYIGKIGCKNDTQSIGIADNAVANFVYASTTDSDLNTHIPNLSTENGQITENHNTTNDTYTYVVDGRAGWYTNNNNNGGSSYLVAAGAVGANKPIFDVAPTSIGLELKAEQKATYGVKDADGQYLNNAIYVELINYDIDPNNKDYTQLYQQQTTKNTLDLTSIYTITAEPKDLLSEVRLNVTSSNQAVAMVSNGKLVAKTAGTTTLTFTSVLNSAISTSITVYVGEPIGETLMLYVARDNLTITAQETAPTTLQNIKLTEQEAILLNYQTMQTEDLAVDGETRTVAILTNKQTQLNVKVAVADGSLAETDSVDNYFVIGGKNLNNGVVNLDNNTPFSIKAIEKIEGVKFTFVVTPYVEFGISNHQRTSKKTFTFEVETTAGVTDISLGCENIILYPNDTTTITAYLTTDKEIAPAQAMQLIENIKLNSEIISASSSSVFGKIENFVSLLSCGSLNNSTKTQIVKYTLTIPQDIKEKLIKNVTNTMFINFKAGVGIGNGAQDSLQLSILKQRIDELIVRNYVYQRNQDGSFDYNIYTQNNTLRPVSEGLITIDLAPINGNYDYLEISDITGSEEIVFVQTNGAHGTRILTNVQPSADGKGIRLQNIQSTDASKNSMYVATMIDSNFTNRKHTVEVRAYAANTLIKSSQIEVDVKMLPEASIYLVTNGKVERNAMRQQYIAQGTTIRFKVETRNSDDVEPAVEAKIVSGAGINVAGGDLTSTIINLGNGYYSVDVGAYQGNYLQIEATTQLTLNNGDVEKSSTTQKYQIVNYVINNISVSHSTTNQIGEDSVTKIYGNLGQNVPVEFFFNTADLSFVEDLIKYDQTTYASYQIEQPTLSEESPNIYLAKQAINALLNEINGSNALNYLTFDLSRQIEDSNKYRIATEKSGETITKLTVYRTENDNETVVASMSLTTQTVGGTSKNYINIYQSSAANIDIVLTLNLGLNNNNLYIVTDIENEASSVLKQLKFTYQLDFVEESSFLEPLAVRSADDFINMSSTGNYILAQDITLEDYSPLDVNLNSFDGNGHTITIKSFALFAESSISAGLFKQIYPNMVVMNLNVNYALGREDTSYYYDLCNNSAAVDYTDASFGGVTAINNGIITNCKVLGKIVLSASGVEQVIDNDSINFNIGGLVCQNATTGRITNSVSSLVMIAKANIAGVVVENDGKIASTYFDAGNDKGKIYAYNNSVTVSYSIQVAGFVLKNNSQAEISMCYVESGTHQKNGSTIGNISAKDYSSGFAFTNSGMIYDCYADIDLIGESSHNHISGFVYENSGNVKNCYSYINDGKKTNLISMFTLENTKGIEDCYEIKQDVAGYKNNVQGLTTISVLARMNKDSYPTLMFGDNVSAVWCKTQSNLPKLVATQEKVEFNGEAVSNEDKNKQYPTFYRGLKDLQLVVTEVKNDLGVVINKEYKYKTLANNFGDKQNPILIYSLATWDYYLGQTDVANLYYNNTKYYYRLINDIDFGSVYNNPSTSTVTFNGNLQGNNMDISNFKIYSSQNLSSIGLFAQIVSLNNGSIESAIRNIDLLPTSITASRTMSVGTLTGVADDYNIYNIDVDATNITVVGGNAVGGVVGLLRGKFDVDGLTSNIGAYASRAQSENTYSIFKSSYVANKFSTSNLSAVYYAGSVIGVADSYNGSSQSINPTNENVLQVIRHITINGTPILFGDTVGGAIGLLGKNVKLNYAKVNISGGSLSGYQYSAGLVGENRGIIQNVTATVKGTDLFKNSTYVSAGLVGFNLNGYIDNVTVQTEISKTNQSVVAGVVGRNLNGYVQNVSVDGTLYGQYVGAVIGADYGITTFANKTTAGGGGAIKIAATDLERLAGSTYAGANNLSNLQIGKALIDNLLLNLNDYYIYQETNKQIEQKVKKVFGLVVGLTDKPTDYNFKYGYDNKKSNALIVNNSLDINGVGYITKAITKGDDKIEFIIGFINIINNFDLPKDFADQNAVLYMVGAKISTFDFWLTQNGYTGECFALATTYTALTNSQNSGFYLTKSQGVLTNMSKDDQYDIVSLSGNYALDFTSFDIESLLTDIVSQEGEAYKFTVIPLPYKLVIAHLTV